MADYEVSIPPGCTIDENGNVFDGDGVLVGRLEYEDVPVDPNPNTPPPSSPSPPSSAFSSPVKPSVEEDQKVDEHGNIIAPPGEYKQQDGS